MYKREKEMLRLQEEQEKATTGGLDAAKRDSLGAAAPAIARSASESGHSASGEEESSDEHGSSASEPEEAVTPFVEAAGMQLRSSSGGDVRKRK